MGQGAGADPHQHLAGRKLWIRRVLIAKDLRPAVLVKPDGFHLVIWSSDYLVIWSLDGYLVIRWVN
jgi:hypothetical protein